MLKRLLIQLIIPAATLVAFATLNLFGLGTGLFSILAVILTIRFVFVNMDRSAWLEAMISYNTDSSYLTQACNSEAKEQIFADELAVLAMTIVTAVVIVLTWGDLFGGLLLWAKVLIS